MRHSLLNPGGVVGGDGAAERDVLGCLELEDLNLAEVLPFVARTKCLNHMELV